jgi:hypothetical protein
MEMMELLGKTGGLQSMARELGVREDEAQSGTAALLPAILGGFKKHAQPERGGSDALDGLLGKVGGSGLLDDVLSSQPTNVGRGNEVLGQIFGSKDVSRTVAENAASRSGLQPSVLKKMLPMVAMMAAGYMAKQRGGAGGLGTLLGAAPRRGGLGSILDADGDGNPLDDIMRMAGGGRR